MKRVAALCLPMWPIERLRRAERTAGPPEPPHAALARTPGEGHWRPGARWAQLESAPAAERPARLEGEHGAAIACGEPPLVTSIRTGSRLLIAAACPRALALGIRPGMAVTQARAQTPGLDIRPADPEGDGAALHALAVALARRWSPIVAHASDDMLFLDVTGVAHLFGGEAAMAKRLVRLLARLGFTARIALADTAGAAWALVRCAAMPVSLCPPGGQEAALALLPVEMLRVDPAAVELLRRLGVERIGQLVAMPRAPLVRRFGKALALRLDQALGRVPEPLDPVVPPQAILAVRRFAEPIATPEAIEHWLARLVPELTGALALAGLGARTIELVAERIDGVPQSIRIGLARPSRDAAHIARLLGRRIEEIEPGYGVDALMLRVRRAEPMGAQPLAERLDEEAAPDLAPLVDTLATRIGAARLWRCRPIESDVPERSVARAPVLDPPGRGGPRVRIDHVGQLDRAAPLPPWHAKWPRPARLLPRPERIEVIALLPDHPPRRFTWRGVTHRVVRADGPERIHGEWWRRMSEVHSVRDYFRVEDEQGRRYWLFRRGDGERGVTGDLSWYVHGVFG